MSCSLQLVMQKADIVEASNINNNTPEDANLAFVVVVVAQSYIN